MRDWLWRLPLRHAVGGRRLFLVVPQALADTTELGPAVETLVRSKLALQIPFIGSALAAMCDSDAVCSAAFLRRLVRPLPSGDPTACLRHAKWPRTYGIPNPPRERESTDGEAKDVGLILAATISVEDCSLASGQIRLVPAKCFSLEFRLSTEVGLETGPERAAAPGAATRVRPSNIHNTFRRKLMTQFLCFV